MTANSKIITFTEGRVTHYYLVSTSGVRPIELTEVRVLRERGVPIELPETRVLSDVTSGRWLRAVEQRCRKYD